MSYLALNKDLLANSAPSPGPPGTFAEGVHAGFIATRDADWTFGRQMAMNRAYGEIQKDYQARVGTPFQWEPSGLQVQPETDAEISTYWQKMAEAKAAHPDVQLPYQSHEDVVNAVAAKAQAEQRDQEALAVRGGAGAAGVFTGQIAGFGTDPVMLGTLGIGAPARLNALRKILAETAIGAGTVAATQPIVQANREALGLEHGPGQAFQNIAGAAVGTLALGTIVRALGMGGRAAVTAYHALTEEGRLASPAERIAANELATVHDAVDSLPLAHPTPTEVDAHLQAIDRGTLEATHGDVLSAPTIKPLDVSDEAMRFVHEQTPIPQMLKDIGAEHVLPAEFGQFLASTFETQKGWFAAARGQDAISRLERATGNERNVLQQMAAVESKLTDVYQVRADDARNVDTLERIKEGDINAAESILGETPRGRELIDRWHKIQDERFSARRRKANKEVAALDTEQADIEKRLSTAATRRISDIQARPNLEPELIKQRTALNQEYQKLADLKRKAERQFQERVTEPIEARVEQLKKDYEAGVRTPKQAALDTQRVELANAAHEENIAYEAKPETIEDPSFAQAKDAALEAPDMQIEADEGMPGQMTSAKAALEDIADEEKTANEFQKCIEQGFGNAATNAD